MPWTTINNRELDWPYALHAKVIRENKPKWDDVVEILNRAKLIHDETLRLDARCRELMAENLRLRHENEFMIRLINQREDML